MRLIDADFEVNHYMSMIVDPTPDVTRNDKEHAYAIVSALKKAKAIEIVRCRECKFYREEYGVCTEKGWDLSATGFPKVEARGFCYKAERRNDDDV